MNSPEPSSPSPSTPSSGSPPPDEVQQSSGAGSHIINLANQLTSHLSGATPSKRRLPGGASFGAASSNRDPKSRRREDSRRLGGGGSWTEGKEAGGKREKEELVDIGIAEYLRKEIGDPFQEDFLKNAS